MISRMSQKMMSFMFILNPAILFILIWDMNNYDRYMGSLVVA